MGFSSVGRKRENLNLMSMGYLSMFCDCLEKRLKGGATSDHGGDDLDSDDDALDLIFDLYTLQVFLVKIYGFQV